MVPHADLKILDPHTNTATITLMHGQMIYDTLFAWDEHLQPKPEMVDSYTVSPDKLVYTFTLRPGLKFHDGQKVTSRDAVASIKRWVVRDVLGQTLANSRLVGATTTISSFASRGSRVCRDRARLDRRGDHARRGCRDRPLKAGPTTIGSGPFRCRGGMEPGAKVVYERNLITCPRQASGSPAAKWSRSTGSVCRPARSVHQVERLQRDSRFRRPLPHEFGSRESAGGRRRALPAVQSTAIIRPNSLIRRSITRRRARRWR